MIQLTSTALTCVTIVYLENIYLRNVCLFVCQKLGRQAPELGPQAQKLELYSPKLGPCAPKLLEIGYLIFSFGIKVMPLKISLQLRHARWIVFGQYTEKCQQFWSISQDICIKKISQENILSLSILKKYDEYQRCKFTKSIIMYLKKKHLSSVLLST